MEKDNWLFKPVKIKDENDRKGWLFYRQGLYNEAWYDQQLDQARWDPEEYGLPGNSVQLWAYEDQTVDFFRFNVTERHMGVYEIDRQIIVDFCSEHPLCLVNLMGQMRMLFPVSLWKKIK